MKKITLSAITLIFFSASIILFQLSCQEETVAKEPKDQGKFLYSFHDGATWQFWIADLDGTNAHQIPISLPAGLRPYGESGRLTSDNETLIFSVEKTGTDDYYIYSVNVDGTNLKKLLDLPETEQAEVLQTF